MTRKFRLLLSRSTTRRSYREETAMRRGHSSLPPNTHAWPRPSSPARQTPPRATTPTARTRNPPHTPREPCPCALLPRRGFSRRQHRLAAYPSGRPVHPQSRSLSSLARPRSELRARLPRRKSWPAAGGAGGTRGKHGSHVKVPRYAGPSRTAPARVLPSLRRGTGHRGHTPVKRPPKAAASRGFLPLSPTTSRTVLQPTLRPSPRGPADLCR